jgi:hypothetical protein
LAVFLPGIVVRFMAVLLRGVAVRFMAVLWRGVAVRFMAVLWRGVARVVTARRERLFSQAKFEETRGFGRTCAPDRKKYPED